MTIEQIAADLRSHMERSEQHYQEMKESKMTEPVNIKNIFEPGAGNPLGGVLPMLGGYGGGWGGAGAGAGAGLGAGLLGGILGGVLLNRNGLLGGAEGNAGVVTPANLTAALAGVTDTQMNTAVLQGIGDIKAAVPLAESQVQLALAQSTADVNKSIALTENLLAGGQATTNKAVSDAIAASLASQNNLNVNILQTGAAVKEAVTSFGVANLNATKDAQYATATAIANSTKEILAALNDQNVANLQRQLTVAETTLAEQRAENRVRASEVNITNTNTATAQQFQAQAQQQQQAILLNGIWQQLAGMQNAIATNSNLIVGNTGAVGTGPQTANPVNVRT